MKNSFILYHEFSDYINKLTDEQAGQLFKAIFAYEKDGTLPELDPITDMVFKAFINQTIDHSDETKIWHEIIAEESNV